MLTIPLTQESTKDSPIHVSIKGERSEGTVLLRIAEFLPDTYVIMLPDEARAIAAALLHFADESER